MCQDYNFQTYDFWRRAKQIEVSRSKAWPLLGERLGTGDLHEFLQKYSWRWIVAGRAGGEFSLMPGTTANPVIVYDDAGRVVDANPAAAELTGIPLERLRGMHMRDFYHPDELPESEERMRTLQVGQEVRFERWLRCCNRRYVRVAATGSRRAVGGYRAEYVPLSDEAVDLPARLPKDDSQDLTR